MKCRVLSGGVVVLSLASRQMLRGAGNGVIMADCEFFSSSRSFFSHSHSNFDGGSRTEPDGW